MPSPLCASTVDSRVVLLPPDNTGAGEPSASTPKGGNLQERHCLPRENFGKESILGRIGGVGFERASQIRLCRDVGNRTPRFLDQREVVVSLLLCRVLVMLMMLEVHGVGTLITF